LEERHFACCLSGCWFDDFVVELWNSRSVWLQSNQKRFFMQSYRTRIPKLYNKVIKPTTTQATRKMSFFQPRYNNTPFGADFAPLFRLLDEGFGDLSRQANRHTSIRSFSPRFDVKEHKDSYTLDGELPGVEQKNIQIEFTDPHTLVIKGRTEHEYTSGTPAIEGNESAGAIEAPSSDASPTKSKDPAHQPRVEDEDAPASTSTEVATQNNKSTEVANNNNKQAQPQYKSWISERSVGEFHRSFSFPTRVDQDAVKASLKNGILSIVVPKAKAPTSRKITIE